jgi:DNA-binding GntR family transcriptional regulator
MMVFLDPPLHERVYAGLKANYLAGDFIPGRRIDLQDLADRHRSSKTPVREAAFILVGEGLFRHHADGGFVVPILNGTDLTEMHEWHLHLVLAATLVLNETAIQTLLKAFPRLEGAPSAVKVALLTGDFFTSLAAATGNSFAAIEVRKLNDRLHYHRIAEIGDAKSACRELEILTNSGVRNVHKAMRRRLAAYHRRRIDRLMHSVGGKRVHR